MAVLWVVAEVQAGLNSVVEGNLFGRFRALVMEALQYDLDGDVVEITSGLCR